MIGDYLLQSDWMATHKTTEHRAALAHALCYTLPFLALKPRAGAVVGIAGTHYLIDRYRLARYVVWAKNWLAPRGQDHTLTATGMPPTTPDWLATGLLILTDNVCHIILNHLFLRRRA
jgi:hypothetical protein